MQASAASTSEAAAGNSGKQAASPRQRAQNKLAETLIARTLNADPEFARYGINSSITGRTGLVDYHFSSPGGPANPNDVFDGLRWGGLFCYITPDHTDAERVAHRFNDRRGFIIEKPIQSFRSNILRMPIGRKLHHFAARKILLVPPGDFTDRFTYHVQLIRRDVDDRYVVLKEVPTYDSVMQRLTAKFPDLDTEIIAKRSRKLVDNVFPVFLTREAAILNILKKRMPKPYRDRIPRVVDMEKDKRGYVRKLYLSWLRLGGVKLSQLEFAEQSAELLRVMHDEGSVIHLDLRLDNFVITQDGVGFVDFGSAVRVGEDLGQSAMLSSLFQEMMRTSQIQRLLGRMKDSGKVTSRVIADVYQKVDKAVDFFYLAVQINRPHSNPDFRDLIDYQPESSAAKHISALTAKILRPPNPDEPIYASAKDILRGIQKIRDTVSQEAGADSPDDIFVEDADS